MPSTERKYRHIVDNSSDLIFLLDENGLIMRMNRAAKNTLGFRPEEMTGKSIYDFIADGPDANVEIHRTATAENIQKVLSSEKSIKFRAAFRVKHVIAGMEMDINFQKNLIENKIEIIATTNTVFPEASELFLAREYGKYVISSNIAEGEMIMRGLIARLAKYATPMELKKFQVALSEILLNAIEHGNLGITFDQKTEAMANGDYMAFLLHRQKDTKYAAKKVRIDFIFDSKKLLIRIIDAGAGFDHRSYLAKVETDDSMLELEHGRGILIAKNVFDRVEYNEKGNQILLVKYR